MMKRLKYLTLATLVAFAACDEGAETVEPVTGSVMVSVSAEGENVNGATVTLTGEGTSQSLETAGGTVTFPDVVEGTYVVSLSGVPGDFVFGTNTMTANVTSSSPNATVAFTGSIVRTASIEGQVSASGEGVEGVSVEISGGGDATTESTQTGSNGEYEFTGLRSGDYTVTISGDLEQYEFPSTTADVSLQPGESATVNFSGSGGAEATISIESITAGGLPITLSNVFGQIEVTANLERGGQTVQEIDVLVDGEVVATQVLTPPGENEAGQVLETLTLNVATDQIEMAANGWVPVIFNGGAFISLNAWIAGESAPIPSNEVPVVMNNPDKILLVDDMLTPDTPEPAITIDGDTWMTGGADFTGLNYLAYSNVMPDDVTWPTLCDVTGTLTGDPTTGIVVENAYDCAGEEGLVQPTAGTIVVDHSDVGLDGPDGTAVQPPGGDDHVRRGAEFNLGNEPQDPDSETRHFIVPRSESDEFDELLLDNLGPTVCIDGEGVGESDGMGGHSGDFADDRTIACDDVPTLPDGIDNPFELKIAFRDDFDEWWINDEHDFLAEGDLHVTDGGVGFGDVDFDTDDITAGMDMSDLFAQIWEDDGDPDTNDCVGEQVDVGGDLDETITSDADFGHLLCAAGTDALGNPAVGEQPSNYFGADFLPPEVRLAGSGPDAGGVTAATDAAPPVDDAADNTIHNIAGDGDPDVADVLAAFTNDGQWGIEAIDDRAGFDQSHLFCDDVTIVCYDDYDDPMGAGHFPVYQQLLAVDGFGFAEDALGTESCDIFNATETPGANGLFDAALPDDYVRTTVGLTADLTCAITMPKFLRYVGWAVDRAGNFSFEDPDQVLVFNFLADPLAPAVISAVGFGQTIYTVGQDAPFAVFGQDDLEVISGNIALQYPTAAAGDDDLLLDFGDFPLGERWGELYDDEEDAIDMITQSVTGQNVTLPGDLVVGRVDFVEAGGALPADAGDPGLADDFNMGLTDEDFLATSVTASLVDAGMNEPATTASQGFIPAQWDSGVEAPWMEEDFLTWTIEQDVDGNVLGRHRANSSVIEPVFDEVLLVLNLNDGDDADGGAADTAHDTLIVCNRVVTPGIQDTGLVRIYLYNLFEIPLDPDTGDPVLDADAECETPPAGATFHAAGRLDGALLLTEPLTFVPPAP